MWLSWSLLHPPRIYFRLSVKPSRWNWRDPLPIRVAPSNSHEELDGEAGVEVCTDGLQPSKLILSPWPMPRRRCRNLMRQMQRQVAVDEDACQLINAASVVDLVTGPFSAHPGAVRVGDVEDVKDEGEEEAEELGMVEEVQVRFSLLLWLSRG